MRSETENVAFTCDHAATKTGALVLKGVKGSERTGQVTEVQDTKNKSSPGPVHSSGSRLYSSTADILRARPLAAALAR